MPIVELPLCTTCGTNENVWMCKVCGLFTCWECVLLLDEGLDCIHKEPELGTNNPNWGEDIE